MVESDAPRLIAPAARTYRGEITDPALWANWKPRRGDILVCTPAKCGTTWTQAIIANLLHAGKPPAPIPKMSPWIDASFRDPAEVAQALAAQPGRRVVKTHTPGDGFPVWDGIHVIAVYRHPLDVFLSLRKHIANMENRPDEHPMKQPIESALDTFLNSRFSEDDIDGDSLALIAAHHARTALTNRFPDFTLLHYADMIADHRGTVAQLARALAIPADAALIDRVTGLTEFGAMKADAANLVPEAGTGIWKNDSAFFAEGGTGKWDGILSLAGVAMYETRLEALVPDPATRRWLEAGKTAQDN